MCLGVPYATSLWQVGDLAENNGTFKTEWYQEKDRLLLWKNEREMERVICHYDVIPLLNKVFHKAFGRVEVNQRAISDRGWGPLNRKLLEHPHLVSDKSFENNSSQSSNVLSGLNISNAEGVAGLVLDRIVRERVKNEAAKQAAERRLADGKNIQKNIKDAK